MIILGWRDESWGLESHSGSSNVHEMFPVCRIWWTTAILGSKEEKSENTAPLWIINHVSKCSKPRLSNPTLARRERGAAAAHTWTHPCVAPWRRIWCLLYTLFSLLHQSHMQVCVAWLLGNIKKSLLFLNVRNLPLGLPLSRRAGSRSPWRLLLHIRSRPHCQRGWKNRHVTALPVLIKDQWWVSKFKQKPE